MRTIRLGFALSLLLAPRVFAQHEGHDMNAMKPAGDTMSMVHVMAQAIPLVTRADPTAEGRVITEGSLTQPALMVRAFRGKHWAFYGTLNAEGLVMPRGELSTGALGEGFVDRRHPHTYLHEFVGTGIAGGDKLRGSLSVGRGFASFGTDDPMVRPFLKYPLNHHLSQLLERGLAIGAVRYGNFIAEGSTFGGDEPLEPSSLPRASRLGDSWALRGTWLPFKGGEVQTSYARVASPEEPNGFGLDQRKYSASGRYESLKRKQYALVEWAMAQERDATRQLNVFQFQSFLAEGSQYVGKTRLALRLEQTERPEEDRLADPFRTPKPSADLSINGITRWRAITFDVQGPPVTARSFSGFPVIEVERLYAAATNPNSLFTPQRLYGATNFWMLTLGVRLQLGEMHDRMGRYGVALP